jgi:hypothetical protein
MKKKLFFVAALFAAAITSKSSAQITLPSIISSDYVCSSDNVYLIDGKVYVKDGATLFIDEGTVLKGVKKATADLSSALVITRSGRIEATGSPANPIVFTSAAAVPKSGDWGGIVILGSAPLNRADTTIEGINLPSVPVGVDVNYGGGGAGLGNATEDKGILNFVRIEYAGAAISANNELNGLTLGGVGRGTILDFIEVLYGADDAFEWFGGTVNAKHLIAIGQDDDAFDFDFGYTGHIQFAVSQLSPDKSTYSSDPNGIESDNNATGAAANPRTNAIISNMTVIGLEDSTTASENLPAPGSKRILNAARFRRASSLTVRNSIFMGYPVGVRFESSSTQADASRFANNIVHGFRQVSRDASIPASNQQILGDVDFSNATIDLTDPFNPTAPDFRPSPSSPAVSGANFSGLTSIPANFFVPTTYRGAFPTNTNWNATWSRYIVAP